LSEQSNSLRANLTLPSFAFYRQPIGCCDENTPFAILALNLPCKFRRAKNGGVMLYYALVFLVLAVLAGVLGFGLVAFAAAEIARICFFVFLVLFVMSLVSHLTRRAPL
jgi:uncharacterized membrane protein YtjA (UPF0391 family)